MGRSWFKTIAGASDERRQTVDACVSALAIKIEEERLLFRAEANGSAKLFADLVNLQSEFPWLAFELDKRDKNEHACPGEYTKLLLERGRIPKREVTNLLRLACIE